MMHELPNAAIPRVSKPGLSIGFTELGMSPLKGMSGFSPESPRTLYDEPTMKTG
jgi:hypothetical protein